MLWLTYFLKTDNEKLDFAQCHGEELVRKLPRVLGADEDKLLILVEKIPEQIKKRVMERPDGFRKFANLDDEMFNRILEEYDKEECLIPHNTAIEEVIAQRIRE